MKTNLKTALTTLIATSSIGFCPLAHSAETEIGIQLIEDVSGTEIEKHGIKPAGFAEMHLLGDVIFNARTSGALNFDVVDEDGGDNSPLHFFVSPFETALPAVPVFKGLTVKEKRLALKKFETEKAQFIQLNTDWRQKFIEGAKVWFDDCVIQRMTVEERFLAQLKANNNNDFRRSDIIGSIQKANQQLSESKKRFLILNSDLDHKPGSKATEQKARALGESDLYTDVVIVVVNTSNEPDKSPLLKGIPNKVLHADSLQQAAELIAKELGVPAPVMSEATIAESEERK